MTDTNNLVLLVPAGKPAPITGFQLASIGVSVLVQDREKLSMHELILCTLLLSIWKNEIGNETLDLSFVT